MVALSRRRQGEYLANERVCLLMAHQIMAKVAQKKPAVILRIGVNRMLYRLSAGYIRRSKMGMKICKKCNYVQLIVITT